MHLFRTKARCLNFHNWPLFSANRFHNDGLPYYDRWFQDLGRYEVTHRPADVGKFRTPSLREVMRTRPWPWMHNCLFDDVAGILSGANLCNAGMSHAKRAASQENDPLLLPLHLSKEERGAIVAFLGSITTISRSGQKPRFL